MYLEGGNFADSDFGPSGMAPPRSKARKLSVQIPTLSGEQVASPVDAILLGLSVGVAAWVGTVAIAEATFIALSFWGASRWLCTELFHIATTHEQSSADLQSLQAVPFQEACDRLPGDAADPRCFGLRNPLICMLA